MKKTVCLFMLMFFFLLAFFSFGCTSPEEEQISTRPIIEMEIGDRVIDESWEWEHKPYDNYTGSGEIKPITWIVVGKNHFSDMDEHVVLLSEQLVARHTFDDSTNRGSPRGNNHWGKSGSYNATHGIRPFLNSLDKEEYSYAGDGVYDAFSSSFKNTVLVTPLPNREYQEGEFYTTEDKVFLLSQTELGAGNEFTHEIGTVLPYFAEDEPEKRIAYRGDKTDWYLTRSPNAGLSYRTRLINSRGEPDTYYHANYPNFAVRPAVNVCSTTPVSEAPNEEGIYQIIQ